MKKSLQYAYFAERSTPEYARQQNKL